MKKLLPIALILCSLAFAGLWMREKQVASGQAGQIDKVLEDNRVLQGERDGLRTANALLRDQVEALRNKPIPIQAPVPTAPAVVAADIAAAVPEEIPSLAANPATGDSPRERPTPTAEEQAERERRQQEWAQRREEFTARMISTTQDRRAYFAQIPTEGLAPEYQASHQRLLQAMDEIETLIAQGSAADLPREERMALRMKTGELAGEINQLMQVEREILLSDYAGTLGLSQDQTDEFVKNLQTITEMTTSPRMLGGRRGGGAGWSGSTEQSSSGTPPAR